MAEIAIVTDSTSDISPEEAKVLGIEVVPLYVRFGTEVYRDRIDISQEEFFKRIVGPVHPQTSQPNIEDFVNVYRRIRERTNKVVSIHISSKVSGTIESARRAKDDFPDMDIRLVDSLSLALGLRHLVEKAIELAKAGKSMDEIVEGVEYLKPLLNLYAFLPTLRFLERGGRIGKAKAFLGSMLNTKAVIKFEEGEIMPVARAHSEQGAINKLAEIARTRGEAVRLGIIHTVAREKAIDFASILQPYFPNLNIDIVQLGATLGVHSGPGLIGFVLQTKS